VATQRMHNAIMAEFGNYHADVPIETETPCDAVVPVDPNVPTAITKDGHSC
jgi:hypothetical protein